MGKEYVLLFKAIFFGLAALILIPKNQYRKFLIYGFFLGAVLDVIIITLISGLFHWFRYLNMGVFSIYGLFAFWSPLAWMFAMMYFLYLLPRRKWVLYPYIVCFALFGYMVGLVLENFQVFEYVGAFRILAPLFYTGWFGFVAWVYIREEKIELK